MHHTTGLNQNELQYVDNHQLLPNEKVITDFRRKKFFEEEDQQFDIVEECYFASPNERNVYLLLSICFYGPKIVKQMKEVNRKFQEKGHSISSENMAKLQRYMLDQFNWDNSLPTRKLVNNLQIAKKKSLLRFLSQKIFSNITLPFAKQLFIKTIEKSSYMHRLKIRWHNLKGQVNKTMKRKYEKQENENTAGNIYLVVIEQYNRFIIGCLRTSKQYETVDNSIRVAESELNEDCQIEKEQIPVPSPPMQSAIKEQRYIPPTTTDGNKQVLTVRSKMKQISGQDSKGCCRLI